METLAVVYDGTQMYGTWNYFWEGYSQISIICRWSASNCFFYHYYYTYYTQKNWGFGALSNFKVNTDKSEFINISLPQTLVFSLYASFPF